MKRLALLLSVYIFTLAITPVWTMFSLVPESVCCQDLCSEEAEDHEDPHEGACGENCNPFQSCHCCPGFIPSETFPVCRSFSNFIVRNDLFSPPVSTPVVLPIWHPPQSH